MVDISRTKFIEFLVDPNAMSLDEANAIDDPIVSMSPFLPARTGTAPLDVAAEIQSASSCKIIPLEIALVYHTPKQVQIHV